MAEGNHNIADLVEKVYTITRSIPVGRVTTYGKSTITRIWLWRIGSRRVRREKPIIKSALIARTYRPDGRISESRAARGQRHEGSAAQHRYTMASESICLSVYSSLWSDLTFRPSHALFSAGAPFQGQADSPASHLFSRTHLAPRRLGLGRGATTRSTGSRGRHCRYAGWEWRGEGQLGRVWVVPRDSRVK